MFVDLGTPEKSDMMEPICECYERYIGQRAARHQAFFVDVFGHNSSRLHWSWTL